MRSYPKGLKGFSLNIYSSNDFLIEFSFDYSQLYNIRKKNIDLLCKYTLEIHVYMFVQLGLC